MRHTNYSIENYCAIGVELARKGDTKAVIAVFRIIDYYNTEFADQFFAPYEVLIARIDALRELSV